MNKRNYMRIGQPARQRGVVLVVALIFMVVLTILGLSASGTSSIETLMAASFRDRDRAFAAAEVALRDAEIRISGYWTFPAKPVNPYGFPDESSSTSCVSGGLCSPSATQPVHSSDFFGAAEPGSVSADFSWNTEDSRTPDIDGLANQPRHLIERVCRIVPGDSATKCQFVYRVTAQATGAKGTTRVTLQEVFVP